MLEPALRRDGAREDDQPGCLAVEPMHHEAVAGARGEARESLDHLTELLRSNRLHQEFVEASRQHIAATILVIEGGHRDGGNVAAAIGTELAYARDQPCAVLPRHGEIDEHD